MNRKDIFAFLVLLGFIMFIIGSWILPIGLGMILIFGMLFLKEKEKQIFQEVQNE